MTTATYAPTVAYFTMEACLAAGMPTYSGGLGVLAGDTLRAAADLGVPMVGVTMLYRRGFFRQHLDEEGRQTEEPYTWDPQDFVTPLEARVSITLEGRRVLIGAWTFTIRGVTGKDVTIFLLDTDLEENDPEDREIAAQLYGGDRRNRLRQEAVLGLGGIALLKTLGLDGIETYHMNEGHCSFLTLALLDFAAGRTDELDTSPETVAAVREHCIFTTHTPVPAGHDQFYMDLVHSVLEPKYAQAIEHIPVFTDGLLNMTYLGMYFARYVNAVARKHRETARGMHPAHDIKSVTNGVHATTWVSKPMAELYDREIPQWRYDNHALRQALLIPIEKVVEAHARAKRELFDEIAARREVRLDPNVLTLGFARRAATYKRADLIFSDMERLATIAHEGWPMQFVFAGKAHPSDEAGKALIQRVVEAQHQLEGRVPVIYLEEHDMALGRLLCSGVDLWLNNPQKPLEASGTSGMKAALNGVPSLSVLDGWWPEGWLEGVTGWSIGEGMDASDDWRTEVESLYYKLRYVIIPLFYGSSTGFARVMRSTIAVNGAYFTAQRMVEEYIENAYTQHPEALA